MGPINMLMGSDQCSHETISKAWLISLCDFTCIPFAVETKGILSSNAICLRQTLEDVATVYQEQ